MAKPNWEAFGKAVMMAWPEGDVDGFHLQELAERHNVITPVLGGFNPEKHTDMYGCAEPGDDWYQRNY